MTGVIDIATASPSRQHFDFIDDSIAPHLVVHDKRIANQTSTKNAKLPSTRNLGRVVCSSLNGSELAAQTVGLASGSPCDSDTARCTHFPPMMLMPPRKAGRFWQASAKPSVAICSM